MLNLGRRKDLDPSHFKTSLKDMTSRDSNGSNLISGTTGGIFSGLSSNKQIKLQTYHMSIYPSQISHVLICYCQLIANTFTGLNLTYQ